MSAYNFEKIENKWKDKWVKDNVYEAVDFSPKPKKYILAELPYPSGAALHAGHIMRYTVPDVYSRYLRMKGYNVMFPMGWDAFGLPAENYAIKTGTHPSITTQKAIDSMKKALIRIGYGIDWNREIDTSNPAYYKWTQWLFLKFYEQGLAEMREMPVWWCEKLKTVLADEEVLTDKKGNKISERDGASVERKNLKQWVLKIPEYAEKLIKGLDEVDFPHSIKQAQINWIGKSEGAELNFKIKGTDDVVRVFTTRIDTVYGAAFLVLSPEHPLLEKITTSEHKKEVEKYKILSKQKSEFERTEMDKDKTGAFTGSYAINPFSKEELPIWIGDFVVMSYATGSIMAVPAHDERDYEFAKKYKLTIKQVITNPDKQVNLPYSEKGVLANSAEFNGMDSVSAQKQMLNKAEKEGFGKLKVNYKIRDWIFSRQRYWGEPIPLMFVNEHIEADYNLPVVLPEVPDYEPTSDATSPLAKNIEWVNTKTKDSKPAKRETSTMPNWAGSCWYFIRYIDPNNDKEFADKEKMNYWLPVDRYFGGAEHTTMHLLYSRFWYKFFNDLGLVPTSEPYQWRINGGILLGPDGRKMSKSLGNVLDPITIINNYGADALRLCICFIGPYEDTYPWNENGIKSCWRLVKNIYESKDKVVEKAENKTLGKAFNKLVKNISDMSENLKMNTCVSEIMIFMNELKKSEKIDKKMWKNFIKVIAPFTPFVAEELWQDINEFDKWKKENSVHLQEWPSYDKKLLEEKEITIPVQINGKVKGTIVVEETDTEETIKEKTKEFLVGNSVVKFIYIPKKIVSVVCK